jgi:hypothetical protein
MTKPQQTCKEIITLNSLNILQNNVGKYHWEDLRLYSGKWKLRKETLPSVYSFHIQYVSDICPINTQTIQIRFLNNGLPMAMISSHPCLQVPKPIRKSLKPLGPLFRPVTTSFFNTSRSFVQAMLDWSIPTKRKRKNKISVLQAKQTLVHIIELRKHRSY